MTIEEIINNATLGATHYRKLSTGFIVYFKKTGKLFSSTCGSISYPRSFKEIKPL